MYSVVLPNILSYVQFGKNNEFVLQNASGKQLFYCRFNKNLMDQTCTQMFRIHDYENISKGQYAPRTLGF